MCDDYFDGLDWNDWIIVGPLAEDIAKDQKRQEDLEKEIWDDSDDPLDMPDLD